MVSPAMTSCEHTLNTLRYADRVKELGANDPAGGGGSNKREGKTLQVGKAYHLAMSTMEKCVKGEST